MNVINRCFFSAHLAFRLLLFSKIYTEPRLTPLNISTQLKVKKSRAPLPLKIGRILSMSYLYIFDRILH